MQAMQNVQDILEEALKKGQEYVERGECASYIPELARADKKKLGVCLYTRSTDKYTAGDTKDRFTIQSISKVISLAAALELCGFEKVFEKMNMEPSGDAFNSLVKLDLTSDKPFNPMINAGAITTAGYLQPLVSFEDMLKYARKLCMDDGIVMDEKVYQSEMSHCSRNRAIAYLLQSKDSRGGRGKKPRPLYPDVLPQRDGRKSGRPWARAGKRRSAPGNGNPNDRCRCGKGCKDDHDDLRNV